MTSKSRYYSIRHQLEIRLITSKESAMKYTKVKAGEYNVLIEGVEAKVVKISKRKWHLIINDTVVNEGDTRAQAVETADIDEIIKAASPAPIAEVTLTEPTSSLVDCNQQVDRVLRLHDQQLIEMSKDEVLRLSDDASRYNEHFHYSLDGYAVTAHIDPHFMMVQRLDGLDTETYYRGDDMYDTLIEGACTLANRDCTDAAGIHAVHCCVTHGCKYNDCDCPVVNGDVKQKHPCIGCNADTALSMRINPAGPEAYYSCNGCGIELNGQEVDCIEAGSNCANGEFSPCPRCRTDNSVDRDDEDELTLDTLLEDDTDDEPTCIEPCIKPECIEIIKPDAVEFWIDNCMSKSLQQQLSTIIIDQPSLFGEIVEYCLEDATPYYRYLATRCANLSSLDDAVISHIIARFETEDIINHDTQTIQAVCDAFSESVNTGDTKGYYATNALYMCVVRSTNASFYAIQAGINPEDIIQYVLNMLLNK